MRYIIYVHICIVSRAMCPMSFYVNYVLRNNKMMKISQIEIFKLNIPLKEPFIISLETITHAENILVKIWTDTGIYGLGECSPYKTIAGESQESAFEIAKLLAKTIQNTNPLAIENRLFEMDKVLLGNRCIKSAFDMALYDISAKVAQLPLYALLGGENNRSIYTDMTVSIGTPKTMADNALRFQAAGFEAIKLKVGRGASADIERVKAVRKAVGKTMPLRIDANQGWTEMEAMMALQGMADLNIEHCEQPIHYRNIKGLANIRRKSPIPIMADESLCDPIDAMQLVSAEACDYFNIKLAKSGGIFNTLRIIAIADAANIPSQAGGFSESRLATTAFAHIVMARRNIVHFDLDSALMLSEDPILGGMMYEKGGKITLPETIGIGTDISEDYLKTLKHFAI
jgi:L-Ala-D/L-Glu epimerase